MPDLKLHDIVVQQCNNGIWWMEGPNDYNGAFDARMVVEPRGGWHHHPYSKFTNPAGKTVVVIGNSETLPDPDAALVMAALLGALKDA
jgi:hypothetical protein